MADLYGTSSQSTGHEPEEISRFLNQLIHTSSSSSFNAKYIDNSLSPRPRPDSNSDSAALFPPDRHRRSADPSSSSGGFNFSYSDSEVATLFDFYSVIFLLLQFFFYFSIFEVYNIRRVLRHRKPHRATRIARNRRLNGAELLRFITCLRRYRVFFSLLGIMLCCVM